MAHSAGTAIEVAWGSTVHTGPALAKRLHADEFTVLFGHMPDREGRLSILGGLLAHDKLSAATELLLADIHAHRKVTVAQAGGLAAIFPLAFDDPYLKKAQLALSMIAAFLRSKGLDVGAEGLTAFADYQLPRV